MSYKIIHTRNLNGKKHKRRTNHVTEHKASFPFTKGYSSHCSLAVLTSVSIMINEMIDLLPAQKKMSNTGFTIKSLAHHKKRPNPCSPRFSSIFVFPFVFYFRSRSRFQTHHFCLPIGYENDCPFQPCFLTWSLPGNTATNDLYRQVMVGAIVGLRYEPQQKNILRAHSA